MKVLICKPKEAKKRRYPRVKKQKFLSILILRGERFNPFQLVKRDKKIVLQLRLL